MRYLYIACKPTQFEDLIDEITRITGSSKRPNVSWVQPTKIDGNKKLTILLTKYSKTTMASCVVCVVVFINYYGSLFLIIHSLHNDECHFEPYQTQQIVCRKLSESEILQAAFVNCIEVPAAFIIMPIAEKISVVSSSFESVLLQHNFLSTPYDMFTILYITSNASHKSSNSIPNSKYCVFVHC